MSICQHWFSYQYIKDRLKLRRMRYIFLERPGGILCRREMIIQHTNDFLTHMTIDSEQFLYLYNESKAVYFSTISKFKSLRHPVNIYFRQSRPTMPLQYRRILPFFHSAREFWANSCILSRKSRIMVPTPLIVLLVYRLPSLSLYQNPCLVYHFKRRIYRFSQL